MSKVIRLFFACAVVLAMVNVSLAGQQLMFVTCEKTPVFTKPAANSNVIEIVPFGTKVKIVKLAKMYTLPPSVQGDSEEEKAPSWAQVSVKGKKGFVIYRCISDEDTFNRQRPEEARAKAKKDNVDSARRNFSEDEEGDLVAMKGAAGKSKSGKADYRLIDKIIKDQTSYDRAKLYKSFRKEGKLCEYAN